MKAPRKTSTTTFNASTGEVNYDDPGKIFELDAKIFALQAQLSKIEDAFSKYRKAYNLMCDETWDLVPDEKKQSLHKKLEEIGL